MEISEDVRALISSDIKNQITVAFNDFARYRYRYPDILLIHPQAAYALECMLNSNGFIMGNDPGRAMTFMNMVIFRTTDVAVFRLAWSGD